MDHRDLFLFLAHETRAAALVAAGHALVLRLGDLAMTFDEFALAAGRPYPISVPDMAEDLVMAEDLPHLAATLSAPVRVVGAICAILAGFVTPSARAVKRHMTADRLFPATDRVAVVGVVVDGFTQVLQRIYPVSTEDLAWFKRLCFHCFFPQKSPARLRGKGSQEGRDGWKTSGLASFRYISRAGGICSFLIHSATLGCRIPKISAVFDCPPRRLTISETEMGVVCVFMMKS